MSGATVAEFIGYWEAEGQTYVRRGDYDWMASLVPGKRVLEIGCGVGYSTQALLDRGLSVLAMDSLPECLAATCQRCPAGQLSLMQADIAALSGQQRADMLVFAPDSVVCWLMGAPADITGASSSDGGQAVVSYRERIHRIVAELAASLPTVNGLHFVDRTAMPWQAKDIGRDTLARYHNDKTLHGLAFVGERSKALYRKLGDSLVAPGNRMTHPSLKGVVPVLASLLAERKK